MHLLKSNILLFCFFALFLVGNVCGQYGYNNRWSLEPGVGINNAVKPYTPGYWSNTVGVIHAGMGVRYMFNNRYGLLLDGSYDRIKHDEVSLISNTGNSLPFKSHYFRTSLQLVLNLGRLFTFENFTDKYSLLFHLGGGASFLKSKVNPNTDRMVNFMFGLTPQRKISNRVVLFVDASFIWHIYQQYTFDMYSNVFERGFDGFTAKGAIGTHIYLGKHATHYDWVYTPCFPDMSYLEDENRKLDSLNQAMRNHLRDDDGDGILNIMDDELDTPIGHAVNCRGVSLRKIDSDGDGIPDFFDRCPDIPGSADFDGCPEDLYTAFQRNEKNRVGKDSSELAGNDGVGGKGPDGNPLDGLNGGKGGDGSQNSGGGKGGDGSQNTGGGKGGDGSQNSGGGKGGEGSQNSGGGKGGDGSQNSGGGKGGDGNQNTGSGKGGTNNQGTGGKGGDGGQNSGTGGKGGTNNQGSGSNGGNGNNGQAQVVTSREGLTSLTDIHFLLNESKIQQNLYPLLNEVVALLKANPEANIVLEGHADITGEDDYNQALSERRSEALRKYFLSQGIDPSRVQTGAFGESKPKFLNTSPKGRALNRRVEIYIKMN